MALTRRMVERIAKLARLELGEDEAERFRHELEGILKAFETLQSETLPSAEGSVVDPLPVPVPAALREDVPGDWDDAHTLLEGSATSRGLMRAPRTR
jgi:aspartyl/glutamyl-tRNA(Asn/Gln) amidotransferase C subunit